MFIIFGSSALIDIVGGRGAHDIIKIYEKLDDAMNYVLTTNTKHYDWLHIYDTDTRKIVWDKYDDEDDEDDDSL